MQISINNPYAICHQLYFQHYLPQMIDILLAYIGNHSATTPINTLDMMQLPAGFIDTKWNCHNMLQHIAM